MPFSEEVRFKIGGDLSSLERTFARAPAIAEAAGRKMEQAFNRGRQASAGGPLNRAQAKQLDQEYAGAVRRTKAERDLSDFRKRNAYQEADTVGRIKLVTGDLARLAQNRAKFEEGSVQWLKMQLQMEEKMAALRDLRTQRSAEIQSDNAGKIATPGAFTGREALRGVAGVIAGFLASLAGNFQMKMRNAEAQREATDAEANSLRSRFATIGGLRGQLTQGRANERDLERMQGFQQNRVEDLVGGRESLLKRNPEASGGQIAMSNIRQAISNLTPQGQEIATKEFAELQRLNAEAQKQHDSNALIERELNRQLETYDNQRDALTSINRLQARGAATAVKTLEVERARLAAQRFTEGRLGTPESQRANDVEVARNRNELQAAKIGMQARLQDVRRDITGDVAGGRVDPQTGARRPRSEAERLAQRAQDYRRRANEIAATNPRGEHFGPNGEGRPLSPWDERNGVMPKNGRPGGVGYYINAARRDEKNVADRIAQAGTATTPTTDASGLKPELSTANQTLKAILGALSEVEVGPISRK